MGTETRYQQSVVIAPLLHGTHKALPGIIAWPSLPFTIHILTNDTAAPHSSYQVKYCGPPMMSISIGQLYKACFTISFISSRIYSIIRNNAK